MGIAPLNIKLKLKLKLTTFDIAHLIKDFSGALHNNCSKGQPLFCVTPV